MVARAAPARLGLARKVDGSEPVCELVVHSERRVVGASVSSSSITARLGASIRKGVVILVASLDGLVDRSLAAPSTRGLAAILGIIKMPVKSQANFQYVRGYVIPSSGS